MRRCARLTAFGLLACLITTASAYAQEASPEDAPAGNAAVEKKDPAQKADAPANADGDKKPADAKMADGKKEPDVKRLDARAMSRKLVAPTNLSVDKVPLKDVLAQLSKRHDVGIQIDEGRLKKAGVPPDVPITATLKNLTLTTALREILKPHKLRHVARDGVIVVTADVELKDKEMEEVAKAHAERKEEEARAKAQRAEVAAARAAAGQMAPPMLVDPAQAAADFDAQEKQFNRQFKAARVIELNFVRKVCEPTAEQLQGLEETLDKYRADIVNRYAEAQKLALKRNRPVAANPFPTDPRDKVRTSLARAVKATLTPEQVTRYDQEIEKRAADRRQAAVHTLVARLDQDLNLSAEQRDKLTQSFAGNWNMTWSEQFATYLRQPGSPFLPNIAERLITPHLSAMQKKIWRAGKDSNNQVNQGMLFMQGNVNFIGNAAGLVVDLDTDDDAEVVEPAPAGAAVIEIERKE